MTNINEQVNLCGPTQGPYKQANIVANIYNGLANCHSQRNTTNLDTKKPKRAIYNFNNGKMFAIPFILTFLLCQPAPCFASKFDHEIINRKFKIKDQFKNIKVDINSDSEY